MSLTDDIKVEILKRLAGADDLARMERTYKDLRRLVAERDGEVWKPMYDEALRAQLGWRRRGRWWGFSFLLRSESSDSESEEVEVLSWKEKFMKTRQRLRDMSFWASSAGRSPAPFLHFRRATARKYHRAYWTGCWIHRSRTRFQQGARAPPATAGRWQGLGTSTRRSGTAPARSTRRRLAMDGSIGDIGMVLFIYA